MEYKKIFVFGVGNYTEVIIELIHDIGYCIGGLFHYNDEKTGENFFGYPVIGTYDDFLKMYNSEKIVVAIGDSKIRHEVFSKLLRGTDHKPISLIHPKAEISKSAIISKNGVYIHSNSFIWTKVEIGDFTIVSPNAMISHHSKIGKACLISANSMIGSYVTIRDFVMVGINAGVISKPIIINENSVIGGQSFVIESIPSNEVWAGSPAKKIRVK